MRISEFFEDDSGRLSMSRLAVFCTIPVSSWAVIQEPDRLDIFLGAYVINYGLGKVTDAFKGKGDVASNELEISGEPSGRVTANITASVSQPLATPLEPTGRSKSRTKRMRE